MDGCIPVSHSCNTILKEGLSVLMLCAPCNRRRPFRYLTKMADLSIFVFCPFSREINWHKPREYTLLHKLSKEY